MICSIPIYSYYYILIYYIQTIWCWWSPWRRLYTLLYQEEKLTCISYFDPFRLFFFSQETFFIQGPLWSSFFRASVIIINIEFYHCIYVCIQSRLSLPLLSNNSVIYFCHYPASTCYEINNMVIYPSSLLIYVFLL